MSYRRILYRVRFIAAVLLPTWVLIARGLLDDGIGWQFVVYAVLCPILALTMFAVGVLLSARASVRSTRSLSLLDAVLLGVWYFTIIAYGLWAWTALAVAIVLLAVGLGWLAAWEFFTDTRARLRGLVAEFEEAAKPGASSSGPNSLPRVIVINPDDAGDRR